MSASLASFASGWLSDKYSRKYAIMIGAYIFGLGAALEAGSTKLPMLIVGRLIVGGVFSASGLVLVLINRLLFSSGRRILFVRDRGVLG